MNYRCQARTLLRALGYAAGLTVGVTAASAAAPRTVDSKVQTMQATPFWAEDINPNQIMVFPGGDPEFVPEGGVRADPCTAGGDANGYDRPAGMSAYPSIILGQFNLDEFYMADDFTPANNGTINSVCWTGQFSSAVCDGDMVSPDQWTVNFYAFNITDGLPGALLSSYKNFGGTPNMVVTQGTTGLPVGINPSIVEHVMSGAMSGPLQAVVAGTCYYVELYFNTNRTCFYIQTLSYEPTFDLTAEGNRSSLRRNNRLFPAYQVIDFDNIDMAIKIGFVGGTNTLAQSNGFGSCFDRPAPANDNISGAQIVTCGSSTIFDNTYATHVTTLDPYSCRKSVVDLVDQTRGDVWFRVNRGAASAPNDTMQVSLCATNLLGGLAGGDSLLSVFRLTVPGNGAVLTNLTQVGCSDDSCAGGMSEANRIGMASYPNGGSNQNLYIRVSSFTAISQGQYTLTITCPIPVAPNDLCTTANSVSQAEYTAPLGVLRTGQTRTATVDGNVRGCGSSGNQSRGVWYTFTGRGNRVLLSTDQNIAGTLFDTFISVYCGTCDASGATLSCVAFNDDASDTVAQSELDFCARNGVQYYVLINGFGGQVGDFGLLVRELRDVSNNPLVCCDPQVCGDLCRYTIPANAIQENGENNALNGGADVGVNTVEACNPAYTYTNATQFNDACSLAPPVGEDRRYAKISEGQTMFGNEWSELQQRDRDWILFEDLEPALARTIVRYRFASQFPSVPRFFDWGAIVNFFTCSPASGFVFQTSLGCPQVIDKSHVFEGSAASQLNVTPGRTVGFLIVQNAAANGGYPCGTNDSYWLSLLEAFPVAGCTEVATQMGDQDETATSGPTFMPTFSGTTNTDGFNGGEPCYDADPDGTRNPTNVALACVSGCDSVQRMGGCSASPITNDRFLALTPNTPFVGKVESKVGAGGASRDIDYYKFTLSGDKAYVGLKVESTYSMTTLITSDDCTADAVTYAIAATRGHCIGGGADADDLVLLNGNGTVYLTYVFATDSFVSVGSGALFANYFCTDSIAKYRVTVSATPVADCSATPICAGVSVTEAETCTTDPELMYDACAALADNSAIVAGDNDGCSESVFAADAISSGTPVCGSLFSTYAPAPDDVFSVDQDYWQVQVLVPSKLTYSLRADGAARVLVAETGAPTGVAGARDKNGGSLCYNADIPVRVLGGENAGSCVNGDTGVLYLTPGWYSFIVSPGSIDVGLSFADYACGMEINYALSMNLAAIGSCCLGNDCVVVTAAECSSMMGTGFVAGQTCGPTYSLTTGAHALTSIAGGGGSVQITGLADDNVVMSNMGAPFKLYGKTYSPSQIGIGSNGYVVFGNDDVTAIARTFPNTANPNAMVAPLLGDWDLNAAGSSVWIRTTGALGSETTIVEWNNVALLDNFNSRATFQVALIRPAMTIEFRYGTFTNMLKEDITTADGDPITLSSGIEDACGLDGVNHALTAGLLAGNRRATFVKDQDTPCFTAVPPCCPGDADSSGVVNFADVTSVLANFNNVGTPGVQNPGDADCSGVVNFADV
ncbi:MAG: hypothetical protein JNK58_01955, partial [Phycisphaerae bacterium]|nr:hypothetical protein [Phycisphaerae bacterium]